MKTPVVSIFATTLAMLSCGSVDIAPDASSNVAVADFAKYISVGSNLTAGYASGGLFRDAQLNSFPSILAKQLKEVGAADFNQPLFAANQANGTGYLEASSISPLTTTKVENLSAVRSTSPLLYVKHSGLNSNFGVPQLRMMDVGKSGFGNPVKTNFNPFFERILPDAEIDKSYIDYAKAADYSFFTCEVGQNDVLLYALAGGTGNTVLSPVESFAASCRQLLTGLAAKGAKGVVLNIANIEAFPAFTKVASLKEKTGLYIEMNGMVHLAADDEYILSDAIAKIGKKHEKGLNYGLSVLEPIKNSEFLDGTELKIIKAAIADLNGVIATEAKSKSLKVLDVNQLYTSISNGNFMSNGMAVKGNVSQEGFFSIDGIHPNPRGQAVIANAIIDLINQDLTAKAIKNITKVDLGKYKTITVK